jgi:hypothetical protein
LKDTEFDIRFNPDVLSPGVRHPDGLVALERLKKEKQLIKDAADFLITIQIPTFIRDCLDHSSAPLDGSTLIEAIHSRGKSNNKCDVFHFISNLIISFLIYFKIRNQRSILGQNCFNAV